MAIVAFDTLKFANSLKAAGVEARAAEAQATLQSELLTDFMNEKLVTKQELLDTEDRLKQEIKESRHEMKEKMEVFRHEVEQKLEGFRHEIEQKLEEFRHEMKQEMKEFRHEIEQKLEGFRHEIKQDMAQLETRLLKSIGTMIVGGFAVITVVLSVMMYVLQHYS